MKRSFAPSHRNSRFPNPIGNITGVEENMGLVDYFYVRTGSLARSDTLQEIAGMARRIRHWSLCSLVVKLKNWRESGAA